MADASSTVFLGFGLIINIILIIFITCWFVFGIAAFISAITCFAYKSTMTDKVIGLLLSLTAGPVIYFVFYLYNPNYCLKYT